MFGRRLREQAVSLIRVTAIELWVVAVAGLIGTLVLGQGQMHDMQRMPVGAWLVIVYLGVLGTAFAFLAQLHAARTSSPTRVGMILSTEPLFAATCAAVFVGDRLGPSQMVGGGIILSCAAAGRYLEGRRRPEPGERGC
jgi:drug/metabolite transporter (DMT)-like permease